MLKVRMIMAMGLVFSLMQASLFADCRIEVKEDPQWGKVYYLENDLIRVLVVPGSNGRLDEYIFKPTGHNFFYAKRNYAYSGFIDVYGRDPEFPTKSVAENEISILEKGPQRAALLLRDRKITIFKGSTGLELERGEKIYSWKFRPSLSVSGDTENDFVFAPLKESIDETPVYSFQQRVNFAVAGDWFGIIDKKYKEGLFFLFDHKLLGKHWAGKKIWVHNTLPSFYSPHFSLVKDKGTPTPLKITLQITKGTNAPIVSGKNLICPVFYTDEKVYLGEKATINLILNSPVSLSAQIEIKNSEEKVIKNWKDIGIPAEKLVSIQKEWLTKKCPDGLYNVECILKDAEGRIIGTLKDDFQVSTETKREALKSIKKLKKIVSSYSKEDINVKWAGFLLEKADKCYKKENYPLSNTLAQKGIRKLKEVK